MTSATARLAVGASWPTGVSATATTDAPVFGTQLKQLRVAAGLTQEALAERAGLSTLNEGQKVSFDVVADRRTGKSAAENLKVT